MNTYPCKDELRQLKSIFATKEGEQRKSPTSFQSRFSTFFSNKLQTRDLAFQLWQPLTRIKNLKFVCFFSGEIFAGKRKEFSCKNLP